MRPPMHQGRTIQDIIDSDDELTTDFTEPSYVPAYKDDTRFQHLNDIKVKDGEKDKINLKEIILNAKDAYCVQCMLKVPRDTCKWFIKFILYKDLQTGHNFLKPCLIPEYYAS